MEVSPQRVRSWGSLARQSNTKWATRFTLPTKVFTRLRICSALMFSISKLLDSWNWFLKIVELIITCDNLRSTCAQYRQCGYWRYRPFGSCPGWHHSNQRVRGQQSELFRLVQETSWSRFDSGQSEVWTEPELASFVMPEPCRPRLGEPESPQKDASSPASSFLIFGVGCNSLQNSWLLYS